MGVSMYPNVHSVLRTKFIRLYDVYTAMKPIALDPDPGPPRFLL